MRLLAYTGVLAVALWLAGALVINLLTDLRGNTRVARRAPRPFP